VFPNFINGKYAGQITSFAAANRLPAMYQDTYYTEVGGLMSYYTDWLSRRLQSFRSSRNHSRMSTAGQVDNP